MVVVLVLEDLRKSFGDVVALDGCSLIVPAGSMVGFLGPNGAGKTTAMRSVFRLVALDGGSVTWRGRPVDLPTMLRFGYMPEERGLYPKMTVASHIAYFGRLRGMDRRRTDAAAAALMEELGLAGRAADKVQDLSHGNQQRVQLAIALIHDPELLVLDEPFSGLDPVAATTMARLLEARAANGAAVLFSSHQLDVVEDLCRDVVIVHQGRVVLSGEVDEIRAASPRRYLEAVVAGSRGSWADPLEGVTVVSRTGDRVRLVVDGDVDVAELAACAARAGDIVEFSFTPPDLSEVFVEAVSR
jgi:ABC-2 type transport system ATP-binding protein